jgi:choline dehydrogenase-like flavoprotein
MLVDARAVSNGEQIEMDLCIVGAGPAGLTVARTLADRGLKICLVESGGLKPKGNEDDAAVRDLTAGRNVGLAYFPLAEARRRGFGGSSTLWDIPMGEGVVGLRLRPLDPIDFEARPWLPYSGWPFDYAHMEPYYQRAAALCRIEPYPPSPGARKPLGLETDVIQSSTFQIGPSSVWWGPEALAWLEKGDATLFHNGTVTQIDAYSDARRVRGVEVSTLTGKTFSISAKTVVLACGGIDNARLLLLSDRVQRGGLGNDRDLVGRYFMEHPHFTAGVFIPARPDVFGSAGSFKRHQFKEGWVEQRPALAESVVRRERLRGCDISLQAASQRARVRALQALEEKTDGHAAADLLWSALKRREWPYIARRALHEVASDPAGAWRAIRQRARYNRYRSNNPSGSDAQPELFALNVMAEQEPFPDSRVLLDPRRRDALGQPRAMVDWRVTDDDMSAIARTVKLIGREVEAAGLGRFHAPLHPTLPPDPLNGGYHHMGTTRMHVDPARGVVDADCRVHGIDNLYVAGSSVFPTGGYSNPTFTLVALAVRLADHLAQRFR